jgi:hypothetical protein|tara:strand:- start:1392 stop:2936 length:1545 start_codon:yes stop_codon:yes gene_type:complete
MKQSTALFKQLNFTKSNIKKAVKSLRHSLQLVDQIHFNEDLPERSWTYQPDGQNQFLLTQSEEEREEQVQQILQKLEREWEEFKDKNKRTDPETERLKITKTISKRRSALKKEANDGDYTEKQTRAITAFLDAIKKPTKNDPENSHNKPISQETRDRFKQILTGTKAARLVDKITDLHNARLEKPAKKQANHGRTVVLQESFFKIPVHNKVQLDDDDYHKILTSFMEKYFPDYQIEMAVFHGNEKQKNEKNYNSHCHLFLNGRNSKTGKYDLVDRSREVANQYAIDNGLDPITKTLEDMKRVGEYRQRLFYEHAQQYLNQHNRQVKLEILPDTEQRRINREIIARDAKKPKSERLYNQMNYQQEKIKKAVSILKKRKQQSDEQQQTLDERQKTVAQREMEVIKQSQEMREQANLLQNLFSKAATLASNILGWATLIIKNKTEQATEQRQEILDDYKQLDQELDEQQEPIKKICDQMIDESIEFAEETEKAKKLHFSQGISKPIKEHRSKKIKND